MKITRIIPKLCVLLLAGCADVSVYKYDTATGRSEHVGNLSERGAFEQIVDERIQNEIHGEPPGAGVQTWEVYWKNWYAGIRRSTEPLEGYSSNEEAVEYMKKQRVAHGLPPYD